MSDNEGDARLGVKFSMGSRLNKAETKEKGRPIYDSVEMVEIKFPGDRTRVVSAPAHSMHYGGTPPRHWTYAERFADRYKLFKSDGEQIVGTPLSEFPAMTEGQRQTYRAAGLNSVEMVANMSGSTLRNMGMGASDLRDRAKAFLEVSSGTADVLALRRELDALKAQISGGVTTDAKPVADEFAPYDDDDLKNMIRDAGGEVPSGRAKRETLIDALRKAQESEAA